MLRVIVTGATGFLGGHLVRALLARGDEVLAIGRDRAKLGQLQAAGATSLFHDLAEPAMPSSLWPADAMVHAAALSAPWGRPEHFHRANVDGTRHGLALAQACGVRRFVHVSTPSIYFRFRDQLAITENAALPAPVNEYARTKALAEQLVLASSGLDPVILRPRGLYGAGDTSLLPRLIRVARTSMLPLFRQGAAATDLTHVQDVVDAILKALDLRPDPPARIFNVSGGQGLAITQVVEDVCARLAIVPRWRALPVAPVLAAARVMETVARLRPGQPEPAFTAYGIGLFAYSQTLDLTCARRHLGWEPRISFADGIERTFCEPAPFAGGAS